MKTINNELIRSLTPCYDPSRYIKDEAETLPILEWASKYRGTVPDKDIIWLLLHKEFLSDKELRLFAVWCVREALKLVDNPDPLSIEVCNVTERYANGEAMYAELEAAWTAVYLAYLAARSAAVYDAANYAVAYALQAAVYAATYATYAAVYATDAATYAAAGDTTIRASQLNKLLTYFK